ncbi:MAG TPA: MFS transporter [Acetobacteraceae bacterium]|nr:MFS transporter [Acetobacteraceae bacterium]
MSTSFAARLARGPAWAFAGADFWRLWYAGLTVFMVRWMETLAMAVFVYQRTGSAFLVAMTQMLRLLPMGLFGAFLGVAADRVQRRTALAIVTLMMAASSGALAALAWGGRLAVWQIMLACFVNGVGWAADNPVRRVAIGEVVGAERMGTAMSLDVAANNGSRMLGPTLGGLMLAVIGIAGVFTISVLLYATSMAATLTLRYRNKYAVSGRIAVLARIAEGLAVVRQDKRLMGTLVVTIIYNVFAWPFTSMVPVIAQGSLHLNDASTGLLQSMDGVGAFLGAILIGLVVRRPHYRTAYIGGVLAYLVMIIVFALLARPLPAGAALLAEGLGGSGFSIMQATLVYLFAPAEMRSRMLGVLSVCIGAGPIGFINIGLLADWLGAPTATVVTGIEGLAAMALAFPLWRRI